MWADNETTLDLLGFRVHANLIKSVVIDENLLPITVGVFGDWGSGKTSIMKMLQEELTPDYFPKNSEEKEKLEGVVCLYFNGWLFEGYDDAKAALLSAILSELGKNKKVTNEIKEKITDLMKSVDWMRLARFGFEKVAFPAVAAYFTGGTSLLPTVIGAGKTFFDELKAAGGDISQMDMKWNEILKKGGASHDELGVKQFRDEFSKILSESNIKSLVVLIDDLDRCTPQRIIDNLEAIKLFLSVEKTAFVIGADPRIVQYAISSVYVSKNIPSAQVDLSDGDFIKDYLEKLIQVPYYLPRMSPAEVQTYMSLLFSYKELDDEQFEKVYKAYQTRYNEDRYRVFGYGDIKSALSDSFPQMLEANLSFCESVSGSITEGLKGNPRQIKRFLNALLLRKKLADVARLPNFRDDVLVKLMVLEYAKPKQFKDMFQWQAEQNGMPKQISKLEALINEQDKDFASEAKIIAADWEGKFIEKWISIEPKLSDIDLRDYFWVARDRLQSTFSGVTMISPYLRNMFNNLISGVAGKIDAAVVEVDKLSSDEREILFSIIKSQCIKNPKDKVTYDAVIALIEKNVSESAELLADILMIVPANSIPPALGIRILTLIKKNPKVEEILGPAIERLKETKTGFGSALKTRAN